MKNKNLPVAVWYNGNQLTLTDNNRQKHDNLCLNIDYLIVNLHKLENKSIEIVKDFKTYFELVPLPYGSKTFKKCVDVFYKNIQLGKMFFEPHSKIINENLCQFQFVNHLFYTIKLSELKKILSNFCDTFQYKFDSINRLDVALDVENKNNFYQNLIQRILNNDLIISGKDKKICPHYITEKGTPKLTGFSIGSRTSSRYLRVYNKTLEMQSNYKDYIFNQWKDAEIDLNNVWRFEYQINNTFFKQLKRVLTTIDKQFEECVTWSIFDKQILTQLLQLASKNHFDIKYNTEKSQINKEENFELFNWNYLKNYVGQAVTTIIKTPRNVTKSILALKRIIKANFREYYNSSQAINYIFSLNRLLHDYDNEITEISKWFRGKLPYYLIEFKKNSIIPIDFDKTLFEEHLTYEI